MKKLIIFGNTDFSRLIKTTIEADQNRMVEAFCVNKSYLAKELAKTQDEKLVAFEDLNELYGKDEFEILVTVGYKEMNTGRQRVFEACDAYGYCIASYIHSTAHCEKAVMGRGNIVLNGCMLHPFTHVGDGNIFVDGTVVGHGSQIGDYNYFAGMMTGGLVRIGSNCFFGMRCVIGNNCEIGDCSLIGAGTVFVQNCAPGTLVLPPANRVRHLGIDLMLKSDLLQ